MPQTKKYARVVVGIDDEVHGGTMSTKFVFFSAGFHLISMVLPSTQHHRHTVPEIQRGSPVFEQYTPFEL